MTKPKDSSDLMKTGKPWSSEDLSRVYRVLALIAPEGGPSINAAIEMVLGRKPGESTLVGTSEWRRLQRLVRTARNTAERNGIEIAYHADTPASVELPPSLVERMKTFANELAAKQPKLASDAAVASYPKT